MSTFLTWYEHEDFADVRYENADFSVVILNDDFSRIWNVFFSTMKCNFFLRTMWALSQWFINARHRVSVCVCFQNVSITTTATQWFVNPRRWRRENAKDLFSKNQALIGRRFDGSIEWCERLAIWPPGLPGYQFHHQINFCNDHVPIMDIKKSTYIQS